MAKKAVKTVKKSAKSLKPKTKAAKKGLVKRELTFMDRLPKNQGEWLEKVIELTERSINPNNPNCFMKAQKERLLKQLADWRAAN